MSLDELQNDLNYDVVVKTGDQKHSDTDCVVKLKVIGTKGETEFRKLNHVLKDDYQRGKINKFKYKGQHVGEIEYIAIKLRPSKVSNIGADGKWYVDYIKVSRERSINEESIFPIYSWITPDDGVKYIFTNKTCLPQNESEVRKFNNYRHSQTLIESLQWMDKAGKLEQLGARAEEIPGYNHQRVHDNLNLNVRFTDEKDHCFNSNRKKALNTAKNKVLKNYITIGHKYNYDTLDDYKNSAKKLRDFAECIWLEDTNIKGRDIHDTKHDICPLQNPKITHWSHDVEFGRQILNGINPNVIRRCKNWLPGNCLISEQHVRGLLHPRGTTLHKEIEKGNIYIINYHILDGIDTGLDPPGVKEKYQKKLELASPICLFHHDTEENVLKPIAIQLEQFSKDTDDNGRIIPVPIWTPKDFDPSQDIYDWLYAKMWFKHADFQVHQMRSHLVNTHLLIEPIAIATFRRLPPVHPIHKLLREHLQFVIAINTYGRDALILKV